MMETTAKLQESMHKASIQLTSAAWTKAGSDWCDLSDAAIARLKLTKEPAFGVH